MQNHKNNYENINMDWSYEHELLYHYVEYKTIESVWTDKLDLPKLKRNFFNNNKCDLKLEIVVGMW